MSLFTIGGPSKRRRYPSGLGSNTIAAFANRAKRDRMRRSNITASMLSKKECRKIVNCVAEKKYFTTASTLVLDDNMTGSCTQVSGIPQGDADLTRDGDQVTVRSLEVSFMCQLTSANIATNALMQNVRVIVFQWWATSATAPTPANILDTTTGVATSYWEAGYNHDTRFQFKVLHDERFGLLQQSNALAGPISMVNRHFRITTGFRNSNRIQYLAGTTNGFYQLYFLAISDQPSANNANTKANLFLYTKMNFTDA